MTTTAPTTPPARSAERTAERTFERTLEHTFGQPIERADATGRPPRHAPRIRRRRGQARPAPAATLLAVAGAGVGLLAVSGLARSSPVRAALVDRHASRLLRARFRDRVPGDAWWAFGHETTRHRIAEAVGGLAGDGFTIVLGSLAAALVALRHGPAAALPVLAAVPVGNGAHGAVKYTVRRPRPVTARLTGKTTPSFPSGHAARVAAVAGIVAYVAAREGLLRPGTSATLGSLLAVVGGAGRVYVDRHWGTDTLGGWGLGLATAALSALAYDRARERRGDSVAWYEDARYEDAWYEDARRDAGDRGDRGGRGPRLAPAWGG